MHGVRTATLLLIFVELGFASVQAADLGYNDFPADLREVLDERIEKLEADGGMCVAGRVTFADGEPVRDAEDAQVNIICGPDLPMRVYEGGWFITPRISRYQGRNIGALAIFRAFEYEQTDVDIEFRKNEITYVSCELKPVPRRRLGSVSGFVVDHEDYAVEKAIVIIKYPFGSRGTSRDGPTYVSKRARTKEDGAYSFDGLAPGEYSITASKRGLAHDSKRIKIVPGEEAELDFYVSPHAQVTIEYVYQPDESRSFIQGDVIHASLKWTQGHVGLDFSDGEVVDHQSRDLELWQKEDVLTFANVYVNGRNGFYDAGEVDFESVQEAKKHGYRTERRPCVKGHVYVVRTYEGHYAKFVVTDIRQSER